MFWSQVLNGVLLPPLFLALLILSNDRRILRHHANGFASNTVGAGTVLLTTALAVLRIQQLLQHH